MIKLKSHAEGLEACTLEKLPIPFLPEFYYRMSRLDKQVIYLNYMERVSAMSAQAAPLTRHVL